MKVLTRRHTLEMARLIALNCCCVVDTNDLTIESPIINNVGDLEVGVYSIESFKLYKFIIYSGEEHKYNDIELIGCIDKAWDNERFH